LFRMSGFYPTVANKDIFLHARLRKGANRGRIRNIPKRENYISELYLMCFS
jgi:hypothetical protein